MTQQSRIFVEMTRRHFFDRCRIGLGQIALTSFLAQDGVLDAAAGATPLAPRTPHFPPKAKSVIYLFMAGGPSQLDLFDYKPKLQQFDAQPTPPSLLEGKRFAFMDSFTKNPPKLLGTQRAFQQYGQCGRWVSECLPHTATVVDDLTFVSGISTVNFNHAPATIFVNTGSTLPGRPSMGSWVTYGLGSESQNLPGFVVLLSGSRIPFGESNNWNSGFLPTTYQGVQFNKSGDAIFNMSSPHGFSMERQARIVDAIGDLNQARLDVVGDPEIATRISSYEMAYRMQTSGPELIDFSTESKDTLDLYGIKPGERTFAGNCLLARRMVERGVRFVQLYHMNWDHHGGPGESLTTDLDRLCLETDQGCSALITDLKQRGLLDETLVVWGGEFGRTPMGEQRETVGRNHHIDASTMWFAGAGTQPGRLVGQTDDLGFAAVDGHRDVHDVQATILHLLGLDHTKLTFRFQGRDFRLTDVFGKVIKELLA
jgi:hypothetical protein